MKPNAMNPGRDASPVFLACIRLDSTRDGMDVRLEHRVSALTLERFRYNGEGVVVMLPASIGGSVIAALSINVPIESHLLVGLINYGVNYRTTCA